MDPFGDNNPSSESFEFTNYQSLITAEIELIQRSFEIKQNFKNSSDFERIIVSILN